MVKKSKKLKKGGANNRLMNFREYKLRDDYPSVVVPSINPTTIEGKNTFIINIEDNVRTETPILVYKWKKKGALVNLNDKAETTITHLITDDELQTILKQLRDENELSSKQMLERIEDLEEKIKIYDRERRTNLSKKAKNDSWN